MALAQPSARAVSAAVVAPVNTKNTATPAPKVVPQPDYYYYELVPVRPRDARRIHLAVGIFDGYTLIAGVLPEMNISLRDMQTGVSKDYALAFNTTLDGLPIKCIRDKKNGFGRFCEALPGTLVPGKTIIALLYWKRPFQGFPSLRGTDTIVTLQP
ncbi:MAG: hypothetical protein ACP5O6_06055 [Candidatus Baltobacteraceae bacterium]